MVKQVLWVLPLCLTACGSIYTSPKVDKANALVDVIEVDQTSVAVANRSFYRPKQLPVALRTVSGGSVASVAPQAVPDPVTELPEKPLPAQINVPPSFEPEAYRIGVSDVLLLAAPSPSGDNAITGLLAAQNKRQGYTVQDDGAIAVPDVGRIRLAGLTLEEAENVVFNALVNKQIDPTFSLEVAEFNSKKVSISGAVNKPTLVPVTLTTLTLQQALQTAGGVGKTDRDFTTIRIARDGQNYQIPLSILRANPRLQNLPLKDGDNVFVDLDFERERQRLYVAEQLQLVQARNAARVQALAELQTASNIDARQTEEARTNFLKQLELGAVPRDHVFLAGEVKEQGRFPLPFETTASVADAIYSKGGIPTASGDLGEIYVLRQSAQSERIRAYHIDGSDLTDLLLATKFELRPDDFIFVTEQRVTAWNRVIQQLLPSFSIANSAAAN